ncbi:hypothetical protein K450DRAFT_243633 [Umbelopsis ramanniana AG]|uniref:TPX2 central domain-containing protein n=1 Tax=Umbelopsis ramanniana AG TaxID=1314678 RepID=A0AAD5E8Z8_UMBRA|nr:uncharacterized protein K450DRAFT_243633 [Umbelopsis ramanniana AG]KAI8579052.1 hypothetical protein K450DRAFT_243633 [Umbelopsis ramanniana AG]
MAHRESQTYQTPPLPGNTEDDENSTSVDAGRDNHSADHVHWDFDAPRFWDLNNPDAGTGFDDTWFARRPVTPNTASPSHRPFSERKPRRSGVKGSPLRLMKTPPHQHQASEESMTFFDLPATPLMSKTLNHSTSHYATPTAGKPTQGDHTDLDIPLSPFLSADLITSSTPATKPAAIPTLPARATAFSTSRQQFIDRQQKHHEESEKEISESVPRGTKRSNDDMGRDEQNQEFGPVIDNIKRRISTIVFKCTNRDITTPLRRRSLLRDLKSRSDEVVDKEDKDATEALAMLKEAIKGAREQESIILDSPSDDERYDTPPTDNIPSSTTQREIVRGTDPSMYMKESPIVTDGERRYITVYLPREPNVPEHRRTSLFRSPHTSFISSRREETENPFEVNGAERESWEKPLEHKTGSTSARLASLNDRLRRAEFAHSPKKIKSLERPRSPYLPFKPTVANGPSLETSKRVKNSNVMSAEDRELEEARKHQFKAHPVNRRVLESKGHLGVPEAKSSPTTIAHSPAFHTLSRHSH